MFAILNIFATHKQGTRTSFSPNQFTYDDALELLKCPGDHSHPPVPPPTFAPPTTTGPTAPPCVDSMAECSGLKNVCYLERVERRCLLTCNACERSGYHAEKQEWEKQAMANRVTTTIPTTTTTTTAFVEQFQVVGPCSTLLTEILESQQKKVATRGPFGQFVWRKPQPPKWVPQCNDRGFYQPLQCDNKGMCWCGSPLGDEVPRTRVYTVGKFQSNLQCMTPKWNTFFRILFSIPIKYTKNRTNGVNNW